MEHKKNCDDSEEYAIRMQILDSINKTEEYINKFGEDRHLSITKTKLEEAYMWLSQRNMEY